jgi:uncharacterized protein Yka (UPF0111/DUF47 family)
MALSKDAFFFAELEGLARASTELSRLLLETARDGDPARLARVAELHADARARDRKLRSTLVDTWLPPIDRDDLRELSNVLLHLVAVQDTVAAALPGTRPDPAVVEVTDLLARGCAAVASSTTLLVELRKNRDAIAETGTRELELIDAGRRTLASAMARKISGASDLLAAVTTRDLFERLRHAFDALLRHALLLETLLLEYA